VNINEVQLEDIERVEIVRGAFSALHGADAFGGVINIVTRDPIEQPALSVSGAIGNEGYEKGYVQHSYDDNRFGYTLSLGRREIDNYLAQDEQRLTQWDWQSMRYVETVFDNIFYSQFGCFKIFFRSPLEYIQIKNAYICCHYCICMAAGYVADFT